MKISNDDNFDTYFGQYCAVLARCHQIQPVQPCILHAQCQVTVSSSLISYESVKHQSLNKSQTCTLLSLLSTCHYVWSSINNSSIILSSLINYLHKTNLLARALFSADTQVPAFSRQTSVDRETRRIFYQRQVHPATLYCQTCRRPLFLRSSFSAGARTCPLHTHTLSTIIIHYD